MIKLNDDLLEELGLGALPPEDKKKMLAHIYETLEMRVGMKLAEQMTDAQLDEFEQFINRNDEAGALQWLETNFPRYKDVVAQEFENLKIEIRQAAPQILASAQQAAQQQPFQPGSVPPPYPYQQQPGVPPRPPNPQWQQQPGPVPPQPGAQPQYYPPAGVPPQQPYYPPAPPPQPPRPLRSSDTQSEYDLAG